eukprot:3410822-Amphidinium_carterae.1
MLTAAFLIWSTFSASALACGSPFCMAHSNKSSKAEEEAKHVDGEGLGTGTVSGGSSPILRMTVTNSSLKAARFSAASSITL